MYSFIFIFFKIYKLRKLLIIILFFYLFFFQKAFLYYTKHIIKYNLFNKNNNNFINKNKFLLSKYFKNINKINEISFNLTSINFSYDINKNILKTEFKVDFFDRYNNYIAPSDLTLYNNLHVLCLVKDLIDKTIITSLAYIFENRHFLCLELLNLNVRYNIGIEIIQNNTILEKNLFYFFSYQKKNKYLLNISENKFNFFYMNQDKSKLYEHINKNIKRNISFQKSEFLNKNYFTKYNILDNEWYFIKLYNYYFCLCKGFFCKYEEIPQNCKYFFYLYIIYNNKDLYKKTDYLFADFIYNEYSSDDAYPVFEKMIEQNLPGHYLTQNLNIYNKYCKSKNKCLEVLLVQKRNEIIDGNFLEKYLTLILKLKASISGAEFHSISNLFYNIDYITHISLGHGISFFKHFLYCNKCYYGNQKYNKILIPASKNLISVAKRYGWTDENIIKLNLPRWDKYIFNEKNNSIFVMFTWRSIEKNRNISVDYFKNILELINNNLLIKELIKYNITLYFALHHTLSEYKTKLVYNKYIKLIEENQISDILSKTDLIVTDFSSIIFDIIYRKKPFIIYIPDTNYTDIINNYKKIYYTIIKDIKEGTIPFKNTFFTIEKAVNKIIYYIRNNFKLEKSLKKFYNSFGFEKQNNIQKFIEYLKNIKE